MNRVKLYPIITMLMVGVGAIDNAHAEVDFDKITTEKIHSNTNLKWTQFGPGGSGNNYYIYWHTTDPNTVYHGPNMGNSYRSTDRGLSYDGILDYDGPGGKSADRGPVLITPTEFSYKDADFGFCSSQSIGSFYVTTDRGLTWTKDLKVSQMIAKGGNYINTICADPNDGDVWYMGSGLINDANHFFFNELRPHGYVSKQYRRLDREMAENYEVVPEDLTANGTATIWKSNDKGKSWSVVTPAGLPKDAQITEIFVHPDNSQRVFAATTYGFYVSNNGGKSWTQKIGCGLDNDIIRSIDMHYDKTTKKLTFFALDLVKYIPDGKSVRSNGGVFKSVDEGESWQNINGDLAIDRQLLEGKNVNNLYYSMALSNWFDRKVADVKERYPVLPEKLLQSFSVIKVKPTDVNTLILINNYKSQYTFSGGMMWKTDNGGDHWVSTFRNGTRWEGADREYWESRNNPVSHNVHFRAQKSWENRGEYDQKAGAIAAYNADGTLLMTQVAKVVCVSEDDGDTWYENDEIDASNNGSEHWVGAGNSNMPGAEIFQDMRIKDYFYICSGENAIWRTSKYGEDKFGIHRQSVVKMDMPSKSAPTECSVVSMIVDPHDVNTLYCTHPRQHFFGKLMKSTDGGENWSVHGHIVDGPESSIVAINTTLFQTDLTIDPDYPNRFYVCVPKVSIDETAGQGNSNYLSSDKFGFYASFDGGKTFDVMNKGLPSSEIQMIKISPNEKGVVYGAMMQKGNIAGGLYKLEDGAKSWTKVKTPNNMTSVHDIYFAQDGKMYISGGTGGGRVEDGGVWYTTDMKSWTQVFPYALTNHIRVAKYDPKVLLVTVPKNPSTPTINPGIYRSLDGGENWDKVNFGNLQSDRIADLAIDYHRPGIYWCTTLGAGFYKGVDETLLRTQYLKK